MLREKKAKKNIKAIPIKAKLTETMHQEPTTLKYF
jgi:hypothetical protein